jgi:hypothetical protein
LLIINFFKPIDILIRTAYNEYMNNHSYDIATRGD